MPPAVIDSSSWTDKFAVVGILWEEKKKKQHFLGVMGKYNPRGWCITLKIPWNEVKAAWCVFFYEIYSSVSQK